MSNSISFLSVVKEIEQQYVSLPKAWRLRVEKWVERLVTSGGNASWARHRNAWARLLLVQVLAKKLEEPFLTQPPDGSLPPFPRHLLHHLKNSQGPHEGAFWRDLYSRLDIDAADEDLSSLATKQRLQPPPPPRQPQPQPHPLSIPSDVGSMKMLIKEQISRIALLEEQLRQEREAHQEQIAQLTCSAATATQRSNKSNPIITSRRIVSRGAKAGLKIYEIARPAARLSTDSFVDHEVEKQYGDYGETENDEDGEDDYAEARNFRYNNSRLHNTSSSRRKEWDWSKEKQSEGSKGVPLPGLSQDEVSFLEYLESFEESCQALR